MRAPWPAGFVRVLDEDWTRDPVEALARKYDRVDAHGWYRNLDPTVEALEETLGEGEILVDYSGGTGILMSRLLNAMPDRRVGVVNVDSSPKFLRLSLEKLRAEERAAFRLIRYLKDEKRLQYVDEVLGKALVERGVDAIASANAIHLYYDLAPTLASWRRILRPTGRVHVQSGNIRTTFQRKDQWIIDDTVEAVQAVAVDIVRTDERFTRHRASVADAAHMDAHARFRAKVFPPVRPLEAYVEAFGRAGFAPVDIAVRPVVARVDEWVEFLATYHEGVLGWVGGAEKVTGRPPDEQAVKDRQIILRLAFERIFPGRDSFEAAWTYVSLEPA